MQHVRVQCHVNERARREKKTASAEVQCHANKQASVRTKTQRVRASTYATERVHREKNPPKYAPAEKIGKNESVGVELETTTLSPGKDNRSGSES
jgi:hypothetical protein